jgi:hypothetical protein
MQLLIFKITIIKKLKYTIVVYNQGSHFLKYEIIDHKTT